APPPPGLGAHRGSDGRGPRDLARGMSLSGSRAVRRALAANLLLALLTAPARAASGPDRPRPHVLTLALALHEGLASDPQTAARAEIVRQAEADVRTASLPPNPSLSVSGTLIPFGGSFTAATQGGPPQLDVGLSYPLDWVVFGKRGAAVASATAGLDQTRASYEDFVRLRRSEIATAFVDVLEAGRLLELARQEASDLDRIQAIPPAPLPVPR